MSIRSLTLHSFVAAVLLAGSLSAAFAGEPTKSSSLVVPPDRRVADRTQLEWSVRWWQWAASFDHADSPIVDRTGQRCSAGQSGDVWFLAGVYGSAPVRRTCHVP